MKLFIARAHIQTDCCYVRKLISGRMRFVFMWTLFFVWGMVDGKMIRRKALMSGGGLSKSKIVKGALKSAAQAGAMYLTYEGVQAARDAIVGESKESDWLEGLLEGMAKEKKASGDDWWMSEEMIIVITAGCVLMGLIIAPVGVWCWRRTRRGRNDNNVAMEEILDPDVENNDNNDP